MLVNSFIFCLIPLLHYQYGQLASCVLCICHECAAVEQWSLMKCQGQSHYTGGPLIWVPTVAMASVTHGLPVSFSTFLVNPSSVSSWMWFQPVSTLHSPHHRRWWTFLPDVPPMSQVHAFNRAPYLPPTLCANYISCYTPHLNSITYILATPVHHSYPSHFYLFVTTKYRFNFKHFFPLKSFNSASYNQGSRRWFRQQKSWRKCVPGWEPVRWAVRSQVKRGAKWWFLSMRGGIGDGSVYVEVKQLLEVESLWLIDEADVMVSWQVDLWGGHSLRWEGQKTFSRSRV